MKIKIEVDVPNKAMAEMLSKYVYAISDYRYDVRRFDLDAIIEINSELTVLPVGPSKDAE